MPAASRRSRSRIAATHGRGIYIVDDIRPWAHLVRIPAHRVLSVSECPMGAHPGGLYGRFTPADQDDAEQLARKLLGG